MALLFDTLPLLGEGDERNLLETETSWMTRIETLL
jgi:hypothetical protein